jgi:hypothetical protein
VFLGLVTQRPAELDPTIISQCSTLFVMRMANDRDQALVRSAVSDAAANLLAFVPSLGTREVFAFGEGVALPVRLTFAELPQQLLPNSEALGSRAEDGVSPDFIASVVERWRGAMMSQKASGALDFEQPNLDHAPPAPSTVPSPAHAHDVERLRLLRKPIATAPATTTVSARTPIVEPARFQQKQR